MALGRGVDKRVGFGVGGTCPLSKRCVRTCSVPGAVLGSGSTDRNSQAPHTEAQGKCANEGPRHCVSIFQSS